MSKLQLFYNFQLVQNDFKGLIPAQAMLVKDTKIIWIGALKSQPRLQGKALRVNLKNQKIFPSFIECHTHTVFAGSRADEFELRNTGASYGDIAKRGGGILSTVRETRKTPAKNLLQISQVRVDRFSRQGVSTLEIKSGYGLDLPSEIKMLEVARKLRGPRIVTTYLGAHAKPAEFKNFDAYLKDIVQNTLPVLKKKKLTNRVDIFVEKNFIKNMKTIFFCVKFFFLCLFEF